MFKFITGQMQGVSVECSVTNGTSMCPLPKVSGTIVEEGTERLRARGHGEPE